MTGATGNIYCGLHEFDEMAFVLQLLRPEDHFLDIGANVGTYTVLAAAVIGAWATSFEPVPATFAHLLNNMKLNGITERARCMNIGLSHERGTLRFTGAFDTTNHVLASGESACGAVEVPVERLDDVMSDARPLLIKIDVEGIETNVVRGGERTFAAPSLLAVIMELNGSGTRYGFDEAALVQHMLDFGFEPCVYEPFSRALRKVGASASPGGNTIFVRDLEAAADRLRTAAPFSVAGRRIGV